jgi:hypothetical protein
LSRLSRNVLIGLAAVVVASAALFYVRKRFAVPDKFEIPQSSTNLESEWPPGEPPPIKFASPNMETVRDPQALSIKAKLTIADLERAFDKTEKILSGLERLFDGTVGPIRFVGGDDYRGLLERIRWSVSDEKKQFDAAFETQFRHPPPRT